MKTMRKILSLLIAIVMTAGAVLVPKTASAAEVTDKTESVTVHKLLLSNEDLSEWDIEGPEGYDTSQDFEEFKGLAGKEMKDIGGVYFVWTNDQDQVIGADGKALDPEIKITNGRLPKGTKKEDLANALADETVDGEGIKFTTSALNGTYKIYEIHELSSYTGENDETLTGSKAVPVEITLPLYNDKGLVENVHVYPKNTEEGPKIDKDFKGQANPEQPRDDKEKPENYVSKNVGDTVDYEIKTIIPAKANYATAKWDDNMTEGLTYTTGSLVIKVGETTLSKDTDYDIDERATGFTLNLTEDGLTKINGKDNDINVEITYSATVNEKAVVAIPESNDVMFHYGNNPDHGNTPIPTKPENDEIKVNKEWADGTAPTNVTVTFELYNAQTGESIETKDWTGSEVTFSGLDNNTEYKVVEKDIKGYSAEYTIVGEKGSVKVKNWKDNNPKPLNPTEPKVITGGAKFVKTNADDTERLEGAKFVIKNDKGEFLKGTTEADHTAFKAAQEALENAIKEYNATENKTDDMKANIKALEEKRDAVWNATLSNMNTWTNNQGEALELTSNAYGQFEIAGLMDGTYTLVETDAPDGYAVPTNNETEFTIEGGKQKEINIDFGVKQGKENSALQIKNNKVTIPQTGGIGSIIFVVAGLMLMGLAAYKMKANKEEA